MPNRVPSEPSAAGSVAPEPLAMAVKLLWQMQHLQSVLTSASGDLNQIKACEGLSIANRKPPELEGEVEPAHLKSATLFTRVQGFTDCEASNANFFSAALK